jgi:hypothetical protein
MGRKLSEVVSDQRSDRPLLVLALTDGEANDAQLFNTTLDQIQDGKYGDVQVLLMGLSLDKEDIEWFEDEECDDTRIRSIEAYEVEQQMIHFRMTDLHENDYNFAMHTFRALVTNYFPADYDYEAPLQTLRHRLYITLHALDRRMTGRRDNRYNDPGNPGQGPLNVSYPPKPYLNLCYPPRPQGPNPNCCIGIFTTPAEKARQKGLQRAYEEECLSERNRAKEEHDVAMQRWNEECASRRRQAQQTRDVAMQAWNAALIDEDLELIGNMLLRLQDQGRRRSSTVIQQAIGCLQPAEQLSRLLQYADRQANDRAGDLALRYLREAVRTGS